MKIINNKYGKLILTLKFIFSVFKISNNIINATLFI